jgi:caffeoyl-CoA O-methyltransferase
MNIVSEKIENYCESSSTPENKLRKELARTTYKKMEYPGMQVGHLEGGFLKLLVRMTGAKRVLEIGTFTGYSSLCFAEGLPSNGTVVTCDLDPDATSIAREFWKKSPHGKKITLKLGPALTTLKSLKGPFDLVFIDADKLNYPNYWEACLPKVRSGGLIVVDNVLWSGRVLGPKDETDRAIVKFNKKIQKDSRVELVMLSVRDGMTLAYKK